ncbi:uncharacterized protein [Rhodnius prolixus]|uniref:uncharacterized protein n=1 Tax=Rhodnius prolixus TaxID=13249 RepID=UPI003D18A237
MLKIGILYAVLTCIAGQVDSLPTISDQSVRGYLTERTCWWNEICKEEFQNQFKCKCPLWSFCRSEGRYYSAYCSMTNTGYIWTQPERRWGSTAIQTRSISRI